MNIKRFLGATLALFAFNFFYEWLVHGHLLMGMYQETASVWRNFSEMQVFTPLVMCYQFILSLWAAFAFTQIYREGGIIKGLLFGLYFGVFAGLLTASWYLWLPVPATLGWSWLASGTLQGIGGGLILGTIYRR